MNAKCKLAVVAAGLVVSLLVATDRAAAEDSKERVSLWNKGKAPGLTGCLSGGILGLCSRPEKTPMPFNAWYKRKDNPDAPLPLPQSLMRVAKLFIDNLQVAQIGDWSIRMLVEIK